MALGVGIVSRSNTPTLTVRDASFKVEIKDTDTERQQGLSGRDNLPEDASMLFVFDRTARRCFWMKDMKFAVDIVWLDESKKVVAVEHSVAPETYPNNFCHEAKYAVEFAAGTLKAHAIEVGTQVNF